MTTGIQKPYIAGRPATTQQGTFTVCPKITPTHPSEDRVLPMFDEYFGMMMPTVVPQVPEQEGELLLYVHSGFYNDRFAELWCAVEIDGELQYVLTDIGSVEYQKTESRGQDPGRRETA